VLQDWTKGRHSEVDDINGAVVAGGAAQEVATPVNTAIVDVAHRIERGELKPGTASIALLEKLAGG
jgi:2-dehydropantoate 2-reductase